MLTEEQRAKRRPWILVGVLSILLVGTMVAGMAYVIGFQPSNLSEKTSSLETRVDNHIAHINEKLGNVENKVDALKEDVGGLRGDIKELIEVIKKNKD